MRATDADLVAEILAGDREAFGRVVQRYQPLICSLTYSATGSVSRSEDLAQETFLIAWNRLRQLRDPQRLKSWLCSIARSVISSTSRHEGRQPACAAEQLEAIPELASPEPLPTDQAISREEEAILWRTLTLIPEVYREPLVLFYRDGQSVAGVAEALELSEDVVKQRLARGRRLLARQVAAFVEGALRRSGPGAAFTLGVLGALPVLGIAATATAAGAAVAKGGATAKTPIVTGVLASILVAGILYPLSVLASAGVPGLGLGYLMSRALRQSARQREHVIRFWRMLAVGFPVVVVPTLVLDYLVPAAALRRGFCLGMTWWLCLIYPVVLGALAIWAWQWWDGLARPETEGLESLKTARRPLVRWLGLGMIVPACVLLMCLIDVFSRPHFAERRYIPSAEARKIIAERGDARFSVEQYETEPRMLLIQLTEKGGLSGFYASANESTLALLAEKGIACPTHVHGRHFLGLPMPQQWLMLLSMFLVAAGVVILVGRPRQPRSVVFTPTVATVGQARISGLYDLLVAIRTQPGLGRRFRRAFMTVFVLVLGFSILRAFLALPYYAGTARLKVIPADPASVMEEFAATQSGRVLRAVVEKMDLNHRWRDSYGHGAVLGSPECLVVLQWRTQLTPDTAANTIEIRVFDSDAGLAAALANAIAEAALDHPDPGQPMVQIAEKASPALKPAWPNKPAHLLYGTTIGALLGSIAGICAVGLRRWRLGHS
ncbi:MAG TPA: sigma-70 family RNA polymerase sigma factor [Dongiaceae bacterium]|nr:sigma-70 family RNA polymerase sigma factor [Dongiaceae bacterium]